MSHPLVSQGRTLLAFVVLFMLAALAFGEPLPAARYTLIGAGEGGKPPVKEIRLALLSPQTLNGETYQWWQLDLLLPNGEALAIRALSQRAPMTSHDGCGRFVRYLFRQRDGTVLEYRDEDDNVLLPRYSFREHFLPVPVPGAPILNGFAVSGEFLGHMAAYGGTGQATAEAAWTEATLLRLRPSLLVGTSRSVRDDGRPREKPDGDYTYLPFTENDYTRMLEVGMNYVGVTETQRQWTENRPFFFRCAPQFPDDFYRANYYGMSMFTDEPMVRLGWQNVSPDELIHPLQIPAMLLTRVKEHYRPVDAVPQQLERSLRRSGVDLGILHIVQDRVPTWETVYESAFYELWAGAPGIVHEGRYVEDGYGWHPAGVFGVEADGKPVKMTPEEMLRFYYACLRGAARAFDGEWGMAIYGQSDPAYREIAMTLAYDMGAHYIWFWTSDHDHHVPFEEQLRLAKVLLDHHRAQPRGDLETLKRAARLAIVFPMGYAPSWGAVWGVHAFHHDALNRYGVRYGDIVSGAMWEGVLAAKRGEPFDFLVDHPVVETLGYARVLRFGEDGSVQSLPTLNVDTGLTPALALALGEIVAIAPPAEATTTYTARPVLQGPITVDGDLAEWRDPPWISVRLKGGPMPGYADSLDASARVAFAYDARRLYIAADINDDVLHQPYDGWAGWMGDCLQIALDPLGVTDTADYTENHHEFGLLIHPKRRAIAWRWNGRVGAPRAEITSAAVRARRSDSMGRTQYEAAIPLAELAPLAPALRSRTGLTLVLNDNDGSGRDLVLETSPGAITHGKNPRKFETLVFEPVPESERAAMSGPHAWAALIWRSRTVRQGGQLLLDLDAVAWEAQAATLQAHITPLPPTAGKEASVSLPVHLAQTPSSRPLAITVGATPGRYNLTLMLRDEADQELLNETRSIFVY